MSRLSTHWVPKDFVELAEQKTLGELGSEAAGARFVMVIPVTDLKGEIAQGLGTSAARTEKGGMFKTLQASSATGLVTGMVRRPQPNGRLITHSWDVPGTYVPIPRRLLETTCCVIPICKRSGRSFLDRVSVGRAHGHDIVLREGSVSKFHGWFEVTQDGDLFVGDAGSRNRIFVDGSRVDDPTRVAPGATVRFGSLDTFVYTLQSFWKALHP